MKKIITRKSRLREHRLNVSNYILAKKYNTSWLACLLDPDADRFYNVGELPADYEY